MTDLQICGRKGYPCYAEASRSVCLPKEERMVPRLVKLRKLGEGVGAYIKMGNAYFWEGKYPAALKELHKALRLNPKLTVAHIRVG